MFVRQFMERIGADTLHFLHYYDRMAQLQAFPLALPKGEPSFARNTLYQTMYRSALLFVRNLQNKLFLHSYIQSLFIIIKQYNLFV